jgi:hypothetical protein
MNLPLGLRLLCLLCAAVFIFHWSQITPLKNESVQYEYKPRRKVAAVVFYGIAGVLHDGHKGAQLPPSAAAPRAAFEFNKKNVIDFNTQRGWKVQTFFHIWEAELVNELVHLYNSSNQIGGPCILQNKTYTRGPFASIEIALSTLPNNSLPFDIVLVSRHDAAFLRPFDFDALTDRDTIYLAQWCKGVGKEVKVPGVHTCRELADNPNDEEGVPDFWYAGQEHVIRQTFQGMTNDYESGKFKKGKAWEFHGIMWGRLQHCNIKVRRYLLHHAEVEMIRRVVHFASRKTCIEKGLVVYNRTHEISQLANVSDCRPGQYVCACTPSELSQEYFRI